MILIRAFNCESCAPIISLFYSNCCGCGVDMVTLNFENKTSSKYLD